MSKGFGHSLPRLIAMSAQYLSWTPDVFWQATPAELHAAMQNPSTQTSDPISWSEIQSLMERENNDRHD